MTNFFLWTQLQRKFQFQFHVNSKNMYINIIGRKFKFNHLKNFSWNLCPTVWISVSIIFGFWQIWIDWPILSWIYFNDFLIWALISEIYGSKKCHFIVIYGAFIEQNLWKWNLEGLQSQAIVGFHKGVKHYTKQCSLIMCLLLPQRYLIMFANFRLFRKYYYYILKEYTEGV